MRILSDYYRVPDALLSNVTVRAFSNESGFFRFGADATCYGRCASGVSKQIESTKQYDALGHVQIHLAGVQLPFDPDEIVENLRRERYARDVFNGGGKNVDREWMLKPYYALRDLVTPSLRRMLQKAYFGGWQKLSFPAWPVDFTVDTLHGRALALSMRVAGVRRVPFIWFWPDGAPNCLIMTHDVETRAGRDFTSQLMDLDETYGIRASFQVVPEDRYPVPDAYVREIRARGFEFNVHDLNHDGRLYQERQAFLRRAKKINEYARRYGARGFRAGSMHRRPDWYGAYEFSYDMSIPNVAHLEPQRGGCCTIFPFFIGDILELPLTTTEDYAVFRIMEDYSIALWKQQVDLIRQRNGLMSFIAHPDYLIERRARSVYEALLEHLRRAIIEEGIWAALPGEVDRWWRARSQMTLRQHGNSWEVEGPQAANARVAFALLDGDRVVYELTNAHDRELVYS